MDRRSLLKSLAAVPFLGQLGPEVLETKEVKEAPVMFKKDLPGQTASGYMWYSNFGPIRFSGRP